jgi:hypothetical protein
LLSCGCLSDKFLVPAVAEIARLRSDRGVRVEISHHGGGVVSAVELVARFRSPASAVAGRGCGMRRGNPDGDLLIWTAGVDVDACGRVDG